MALRGKVIIYISRAVNILTLACILYSEPEH